MKAAINARLVVDKIDFNDRGVVERALNALRSFVADPSHYRPLRVKKRIYFQLPDGGLPSEAGWYVLLVGKVPLYAGRAENLDNRLNKLLERVHAAQEERSTPRYRS